MSRTFLRAPLVLLSSVALAPHALAQGPVFESPGSLRWARFGQLNQFSTEFNPAFGAVLDAVFDYRDLDGADDGFDAAIRLFEINTAAYVDPEAWAYAVLTSEDLEAPEFEEAAVQWTGLGDRTSLRAGRFFVDFGKLMQYHLEELRTLERPLVLREYLGEELGGTGVQLDHWLPLNDTTPLRFSIGMYSSLLGESHEEEESGGGPEAFAPDRKDIDELSFSARVTAMTEVGARGTLQLGASTRYVPEFAFEDDELGIGLEGQSNGVYGFDVTYGWNDDSGIRGFTTGLEWLLADGDLSASVDDAGTPLDPSDDFLVGLDDTASGFYAFADYVWSQQSSAGVQFSQAEFFEDPATDASELDVYYTHRMTEMRRLRLGVTLADADEVGDESRIYVQFTNFLGNHTHGWNW